MPDPMSPETLVEAGWQRIDAGGFTNVAGPFFSRREDGQRVLGLVIEERHCNNHIGTVHGGVIMTFADLALGVGVAEVLGGSNCATASLQTQFLSVARVGEFMTCRPEVVRHSKQLVFVRGLVMVDDRNVASIEAIWKVLEPR